MKTPKSKVLCYINIVTFNNEPTIAICLRSIRELNIPEHVSIKLSITDNCSSDGTLSQIDTTGEIPTLLRHNDENLGFCKAHNDAITEALNDGADFVLVLNPDLKLHPDSLTILLESMERDRLAGSACPKLFRADSRLSPVEPPILDACGMYVTPATRHFDRGSGQPDAPCYNLAGYVFGASGAAILLRKEFIKDVSFRLFGDVKHFELFDEAFFAYREDADLAWRAQYLGWRCRYVPQAIGYHQRKVLPERRASLPRRLNSLSVRNRFLLQFNNFSFAGNLHCLISTTIRNLMVLGGVVILERSSLGALKEACLLFPRALRHRRVTFQRRRVSTTSVGRWFQTSGLVEPALDYKKSKEAIRFIRAIIVNFNSGERLKHCLESLSEAASKLPQRLTLEIVVVDNHSHDESVKCAMQVIDSSANITLERAEYNLGFARAINWATSRSEADAFLILNPDAVVTADAAVELVRALNSHRLLGVAAPILVDSNSDVAQLGFTARRFPTLGATLCELFFLHRLWPTNPWTSYYRYSRDVVFSNYATRTDTPAPLPSADLALPFIVDQPAGACVLIRRDVLEQIGGFDDKFYPAWFEDVDLFKRLYARGIYAAVVTQARVEHEGGYSRKFLSDASFIAIWYPNLVRYWAKHSPPGKLYLLYLAIPVAMMLRCFVALVRGVFLLILSRSDDAMAMLESAKAYLLLAGRMLFKVVTAFMIDVRSLFQCIIESARRHFLP